MDFWVSSINSLNPRRSAHSPCSDIHMLMPQQGRALSVQACENWPVDGLFLGGGGQGQRVNRGAAALDHMREIMCFGITVCKHKDTQHYSKELKISIMWQLNALGQRKRRVDWWEEMSPWCHFVRPSIHPSFHPFIHPSIHPSFRCSDFSSACFWLHGVAVSFCFLPQNGFIIFAPFCVCMFIVVQP